MHPDLQDEAEPPLFAALRRADERTALGEVAGGDVAVQLGLDEHGAWLEILDEKGRPRDPDYRAARGALRDLLKAMALIRRRQQHLVGWESSAERVYLHHHEHLLWPLRNCPGLVGPDRQPLGFAPGTVEIVLDLVPGPAQESPWLTGRLLLVRNGETLAQADQFRFLNETHVLANNRIYETPPVGENFARLPLFASSFPEAMLERCLSLLFSHFTAADTVFIFDPWWNTAAEVQAVDRAHRIGQDRTVFTYKLIVRDSVEEKILQLQERKKQLVDAVIGSDGVALKSLSEADVDEILG